MPQQVYSLHENIHVAWLGIESQLTLYKTNALTTEQRSRCVLLLYLVLCFCCFLLMFYPTNTRQYLNIRANEKQKCKLNFHGLDHALSTLK